MTRPWDVLVVGAGIMGLAVAREVLQRYPSWRVLVLEQEKEIASHQTSHNSGVVHAGLYYPAGSAKARLCATGRRQLVAFCADREIPITKVGKLVIAVSVAELPRLDELEARARANGVPGIQRLDGSEISRYEPFAVGVAALHSPYTAIVDFHSVACAYAADVYAAGGEILTRQRVTLLQERTDQVVVGTENNEYLARTVIACAGLWADKVARLSGSEPAEQIIPFRGDYYRLAPAAAELVRGLIYPVPDDRFPFLGIHLTRRHNGEVWAGPNAVLALARAGYRRRDISPSDLIETLRFPGFRALAKRYWSVGVSEQWRDISRRSFAAVVRRYVPSIRDGDLHWGPSGVRAQALDPDGSLVDDFRIGGSTRILHVRNAPSPAATASLALASEVVDAAEERWGERATYAARAGSTSRVMRVN